MTEASIFQCHACREFINSSMAICRFCSVTIDPHLASSAINLQEKVNAACNHASLSRNFAGAMLISFFARLIPIVGIAFFIIFIIGFFGVPIQLLIWQIKYANINTSDPDYKTAKHNILVAFIIWLILVLVAFFIVLMNIGLLYLQSQR